MRDLQIVETLFNGGLIVEVTHESENPVYKLCAPINEEGINLVVGSISPQRFATLLYMLEQLPYDGAHIHSDTQYRWYSMKSPVPATLGKLPKISLAPAPSNNVEMTEAAEDVTGPTSEEIDVMERATATIAESTPNKTLILQAPKPDLVGALQRIKGRMNGTYKDKRTSFLFDIWTLLRHGAIISVMQFPTVESRQFCPYAPEEGNIYNLITKPINGRNRLCGSIPKDFFDELFVRNLITPLPVVGTHKNGAEYRWYRLNTPDYTSVVPVENVKLQRVERTDNISKV